MLSNEFAGDLNLELSICIKFVNMLIINALTNCYFPMQIIVLLDNQYLNALAVQYRYLFRTRIECKVLISKYSSSNFVMQI